MDRTDKDEGYILSTESHYNQTQLEEQQELLDDIFQQKLELKEAIQDGVYDQKLKLKEDVQDSVFDQKPELKEDVQDGVYDQKLKLKEDVQDGVFDQKPELKEDVQDGLFDQKPELKEDVFQNITKDGRYLVYSAYVDGPQTDRARAIGLSKTRQENTYITLNCLFWDTTMRALSIETNVTIWIIPRHVEDRYKSAIFTCPIPARDVIALTIKSTDHVTSIQEAQNVVRIKVSPKLNRTFTICLRPIHFKKTAAYDIVEWVEYYRIMGVDHFVIYNFTSDSLTDRVLRYYVNAGLMDVIQWHVPEHVIPKEHYYNLKTYNEIDAVGQFAMLNDFLYRVYWSTKFIINVDLDEFIVPLNGSTSFNQLLSTLPAACQYLIRNTLIPLNQSQSEQFPNKEIATNYHLKTILYRKRMDYVFKPRWKTKYIANTKCSQVLWVHDVFQSWASSLAVNKHVVDENAALVFHYRQSFDNGFFKDFQRGSTLTEIKTLQPFIDRLLTNVQTVWDLL